MTVVVENARYRGIFGDLKVIVIQTNGDADSSHTINLHSDITDGRGAEIKEVLLTLIQDDEGLDEEIDWDPATGILTLKNIASPGIHNILIIGR